MNAEPIIEAIENIEHAKNAQMEHEALIRGLLAVLNLPAVQHADRSFRKRDVYVLADGWHLAKEVVIDQVGRRVVTDCGRVIWFEAIEDFRMYPHGKCEGCG